MSNSPKTLYFRNFEAEINDEELRDYFSSFGAVFNFFIHKNRQYGMVEFEDASTCDEVLQQKGKPPHYLFLNMAKNQNPNDTRMNETRGPVQRNYNQSFNSAPSAGYVDEELFYDENNCLIDVLKDPATNEIYVPLRYAPNIRRIVKKKPAIANNGYLDGDIDIDETLSANGSLLNRKVHYNQDSIAIECNFDTEIDNSHMGSQKFQRPREKDSFNTPKHFNRDESKNRNKPAFSQASGEENKFQNRKFQSGAESKYPKFQNRDFNKPNVADTKERNWNSESTGTKSARFPKKEFNTPKPTANEGDWSNETSEVKSQTFNKSVSKNTSKSPENNMSTTLSLKTSTPNDPKPNEVSYKTVELPKNKFTEVRVETALSDTKGWVQISDNDDEFMSLMENIMEKQLLHPKSVKPEIGKICLAHFESTWFRAIVLSTTPAVKVRFIDYGNEMILDRNILELSREFQNVPAYAVCINLVNGAPNKLYDSLVLKVKPVAIENDVVQVQVENGIYETKTLPSSTNTVKSPNSTTSSLIKKTKKANSLDACQKSMMDNLDVAVTGLFTPTIKLSDTQGVAFFVPLAIADDTSKLENIADDIGKTDPSFKPQVGDLVAAEYDNLNRAYILDIDGDYKVAFIDFGVIATVAEVKPLPPQYINIPQFSCIFTTNHLDKFDLDAQFDFTITKIVNNVVHCNIAVEDDVYETTFIMWTPKEEKKSLIQDSSSSASSLETVKAAPKKLEPPELKLKSGDTVKIMSVIENIFYLRTKEGNEILKRIKEYMADYAGQAPKLTEPPVVGQFVAVSSNSEWRRAQVIKVNPKTLQILHIDYGEEESKMVFSLKHLDKKMCSESWTLAKAKLRGFVNKPFTSKEQELLKDYINIFLKVNFEGSVDDGIDLTTKEGENIADILSESKVEKPFQSRKDMYLRVRCPAPDAPIITQLPLEPLPIGKGKITFLYGMDYTNNLICVCLNDPKILHEIHTNLVTQMTKYVQHLAPKSPYCPKEEEFVLVQQNNKWFRAMCLDVGENQSFEVFFVDYGFSLTVPADQIRRIPQEFTTEHKALANFARIAGLPEEVSSEVIDRLQTLLLKNEIYEVDVLSKSPDDFYDISFPQILEDLRANNLI